MTDSPGKVLSSFASSNERKGDTPKVGGCAGVFFQLLDRFNGRKFLPHKLLPSERSKHNTISHTEEKLPMAKLLLIADEKRLAAAKKEKETLSDRLFQGNENLEGREKMPVSVVAKLMGLETMPPFKLSRERKQIEVLKEEAEGQSARKPLQSKKVSCKRAQRNTKAMDIRMQSLKRATKPSHTDDLRGLKVTGANSVTNKPKHPSVTSKSNVKSRSCATITPMNSRKVEDSRTFIFTKFPLPTIQMESQLRSILSPSRTSNKLLSPVKSPLSSRSAARLFGAAAKVLEPNLHPAKQLGFSPQNVNSAPHGNSDEDNKKQNSTLIAKRLVQSNAPFTECKDKVTSKNLNSNPEKIRKLYPNRATKNRQLNAREGVRKTLPYVKGEKLPNKILSGKKQSLATDSCKLEANDSTTGGCSLRTSSTTSKTSANSTHIGNKQENMLATGGGSKQEGLYRPHMSLAPHGAGSAKDTNHGTNFQPLRFERSRQINCPSNKLAQNTIQEGSRNFKVRFANDSKSTSLGKTSSTGAQGRTNVVQPKRESSCSGSSSKRKASSLSPKRAVLSYVAGAVVGDFKLQNIENERRIQRLAHERQSVSPQSDSNVPVICYDESNMTSSIEVDSMSHSRVRAKWDVADERKKGLTMSRISCNVLQPTSRSVGNNPQSWRPRCGTNEHNPLFCSDGSEALNCCSTTYNKESTNLIVCSSSMDGSLGGAQLQSRSYGSTSLREGSCAQDRKPLSGSFCAEECEQPSPISILDSPFHDSASCSSDSFEAPQGLKLWEALENESLDDLSTVANHVESPGFLTMSQLHCIDSRSSDVVAESHAITDYEDKYVKKILGNALQSAESAVWERLALSGPLIDPLIYYQLEEGHLGARVLTGVSKEFDRERDQCYTRTCTTFTAWCKEGAPQRRKLFFDCIEVALKLCLELAMQSYGFILPFLDFPPAYLQKAVEKHLGEWKELAFSMNLDDMMAVEINSGMGQWFKYGGEVEIVAANVETMIFNSLIDELLKDVLKDAQAPGVCR